MLTFADMENRMKEIYDFIDRSDIGSAITLLYSEVYTDSSAFESQLTELKGIYRSLLSFYADGVEDKNRQQMILFLQQRLLTLTDSLFRHRELRTCADLYYSKLRVYQGVSSNSLSDLLADAVAQKFDRPAYERIMQTAFEMVWTTDGLSDEDKSAIDSLDEEDQALLISALALGLKKWWRTSDFLYLMSKLVNPLTPVRVLARAYVEFVVIIATHPLHARLFESEIEPVFSAIADSPVFPKAIRLVFSSFYLSMATEQIAQGMQRKLRKNMRDINVDLSDINSVEDLSRLLEGDGDQPKWKDKLESSAGLEKTLREFNDLQEEGMDMMHSSFMNLKTDFFFRNTSNWFVPFSLDHSRIRKIIEEVPTLADMGPLFTRELCDSDKFSFFFMIESLPASAKSQMIDGFGASLGELSDKLDMLKMVDGNSELLPEIRSYIKSLYRFYKLYDLKSEFEDIFREPLSFRLPILQGRCLDYKSKELLSALMFRHELYDLVIPVLSEVLREKKTAEHYEQFGYAAQMLNKYSLAMKSYMRADIMSNGKPSLWLYKQMAYCAREMNDLAKAHDIFMEIYELKLDSKAILYAGSILLDMEKYKEASVLFERYMEDSGRRDIFALRPLAWCFFKMRSVDKAFKLYSEICSLPKAGRSDFLNLGHCYFINSQIKEAVKNYRHALSLTGDNMTAFSNGFKKDKPELLAYGISEEQVNLMKDAVIHQSGLL